MKKIGLAIATYNEATNITKLLQAIDRELAKVKDVTFEVLVIDDSSPDGTADLVRSSAKKLNRPDFHIDLLLRKVKDGFGRAYVAGFKQLLNQKVDFIMMMDADFSHQPKYLTEFIKAALAGHDLVVASRYIKGGGTPDWPWQRRFMSKYGNFYARVFLGRPISDYTGGFNLFSSQIIKQIDLDTLQAGGYGFLIEFKYRALQLAKSLVEIPIIFPDRQLGESKLPKNTLLKNLILVPRLRFAQNKPATKAS